MLGLWLAEQDSGKLKINFQKSWDAGSQNKTSAISTHALSEILGLGFAEQNVGYLKHALPEFLGLRLAEQSVGNLRTCTSRTSGTLVHRKKHVGSLEIVLPEFSS